VSARPSCFCEDHYKKYGINKNIFYFAGTIVGNNVKRPSYKINSANNFIDFNLDLMKHKTIFTFFQKVLYGKGIKSS